MGTTRVLSHVLKSCVLVYVDIPPPPVFDAAINDPKGGIAAALGRYRIREVNVRKWSANRNR
jgi:tRNA-splicing endonuclease subunit Sen2